MLQVEYVMSLVGVGQSQFVGGRTDNVYDFERSYFSLHKFAVSTFLIYEFEGVRVD